MIDELHENIKISLFSICLMTYLVTIKLLLFLMFLYCLGPYKNHSSHEIKLLLGYSILVFIFLPDDIINVFNIGLKGITLVKT